MCYFFKCFVYILILFSSAYCDIENHLKALGDKPSSGHNMSNIDYIYMINLDHRPEKWENSLNQLEPFGIVPYRFSAVNGKALSLETINDIGVKYESWMEGGFMGTCYKLEDNFEPTHEIIGTVGQTYFRHKMGRGRFGIVLSHLSVLQDALDSGYETIWLMEDDIDVLEDPRVISDLIEVLDNQVGSGNWDILFTDRDIRKKNGDYMPGMGMGRRPDFNPKDKSRFWIDREISSEFRRIGGRFGAHSMIIRRSGMKKILDFFKTYQIFLPYDNTFHLPEGIKLYTVNEDVVSNLPNAISDNIDCP